MRRFGLIGKSLKHSFSKNYFTEKFTREHIPGCSYENFELPAIERLPGLVNDTEGLEGLNVTIPYKELVLSYLSSTDPLVDQIGACNCIMIADKKMTGYNTDAPAFRRSLQPRLKQQHKCALILGSGGASKAVQSALTELGIDFLIVSRHKKGNEIGYEDLGKDMIAQHLLIINTTPVGMFPNVNEDPSLPYEAITPDHLLFDLIYNPEVTRFLQQGKERGADILNGLDMLKYQAEESWAIWNGS